MRRNLVSALAVGALVAAGCSGGGSKSSGSAAYTGGTGTFNVAVVKPDNGFVTSSIGGIDCGSSATAQNEKCDAVGIATANTITLTAAAAPGYKFRQWAGDCAGTASTCALTGGNGTDASAGPPVVLETGKVFRVVAVFDPVAVEGGESGTPELSRVYGYVKDNNGAAAPGIKITFGADVKNANGIVTTPAPNVTSGSNGSFVVDVAPGTYALTFADTSSTDPAKQLYTVPLPASASITVPARADAACLVKSDATSGEGAKGCIFRYDFLTGITRTAYTAPAAVAVTASATLPSLGGANKLAGFGQTVGLSCSAAADAKISWSISAGPVAITLPAAQTLTAGTALTGSITTPTVQQVMTATKVALTDAVNCPNGPGAGKPGSPAVNATGGNKPGCGVSNFFSENRPGFLAINRQQATEMQYTLVCTATVTNADSTTSSYTKSVTVPLVQMVNINVGNTLENLWNRFNGSEATVPVATGNWCAEGGTTPCDRFGNPIAFRATHFVPKAPTGAIVILDDYQSRPEGYSWAWRKTSSNTRPTGKATSWCLVNDPVNCDAASGTPTLYGASTANPWFVAGGTAGQLVNTVAVADNAAFKAGPTAVPLSFQANYSGYENSCGSCHDPKWGDPSKPLTFDGNLVAQEGKELGPNKLVTEWKGSAHARIVTDGMQGTHYTTSCFGCHVLGWLNVNSPAGTVDVLKLWAGGTFNWNSPAGATFTTPATAFTDFTFAPSAFTNYAALDPQIRARMNVQCESCHGPAGAGGKNAVNCNALDGEALPASLCAAGDGVGGTMHSANESAKVCGQCHDGGHHGIYSQWNSMGHANLEAMNIAVVESNQTNTNPGLGACYSCHSAQQYINYVALLKSGSQAAPPPIPTLEGQLGAALDYRFAQPITCQACHEPHSLELRLEPMDALKLGDSTKQLNCFFGACTSSPTFDLVASNTEITLDRTSGAGQLCSTCHNSRAINGLQQNGATAPVVFSQPHHGTQTDVYMGVNMFWFGAVPASVSTTNVHRGSFFKDSCVDCHVKLVPAGYPTVANHSFDPNPSCFACHGSGTLPTGENTKGLDVKARTAAQMAAIQDALAANVKAFINANAATLTTKNDGVSPAADFSFAGKTVSKVEIAMEGLYSKPGFAIFVGTDREPTLLSNVDSFRIGGAPLVAVGGANEWMFKVLWNYMLVAQDKSGGIHNMYVVNDLLNQTLTQASHGISVTP